MSPELRPRTTELHPEEHRGNYEQHLLTPLRALTAGLTQLMLSMDSDLIITPARVISRIHRDTRFSHDKSPYKTTLYHSFSKLRIAG